MIRNVDTVRLGAFLVLKDPSIFSELQSVLLDLGRQPMAFRMQPLPRQTLSLTFLADQDNYLCGHAYCFPGAVGGAEQRYPCIFGWVRTHLFE
jgi:hypothetical protein